MREITKAVAALIRGEPMRSQASPSPPIRVVAQINQAMTGGLEKYPKSRWRDQSQYWASSGYNSRGVTNSATTRKDRQNPDQDQGQPPGPRLGSPAPFHQGPRRFLLHK
jgi:hypothetical protein